MTQRQRKIHTGFRLSKDNIALLERMENKLGLNKTSVVDMILTVVRNDERLILGMIKKALQQ